MTDLSRLGEFGLIERIARILPGAPTLIEGIGDDCAVVRIFDRLMLLSCDMFVEDVHFRRRYARPQDVGWKAATSALSDVAAMGGTPLFSLVSLACPAHTDSAYVEGLYHGITDAVGQAGAVVVGGDTTMSPSGIAIDVTVI
ncbi:MAG: thiamine-phosphate kinase, partial [Burkholderiales bacterium]|nr:thiamine-phosphate kinase [Burkholderiales bacterium]